MFQQSDIVQKFSESSDKLCMTIVEAELLSNELADRIRPLIGTDIDLDRVLVVGIANGGLMIARIVADSLSAPLEVIGIRRSGSRLKRALSRFKVLVRLTAWALGVPILKTILAFVIDNMNKLQKSGNSSSAEVDQLQYSQFEGKHVVLIDDCIESGQTLKLAKKIVIDAGAIAVTTGVISVINIESCRDKLFQFDPLVYINGRAQHCYPWSQNNVEYDDFFNWLESRGVKAWV